MTNDPEDAMDHTGGRSDRPFDAGLQLERSALAWRRTALALSAASLAALRSMPDVLGVWALVPTGAGAAASVAALFLAHRRYRRIHTALSSSETWRAGLSGGRLPALMAGVTVLGGLTALLAATPLGQFLSQ